MESGRPDPAGVHMMAALKSIARKLGLDTRNIYQLASARSIDAAVREQGLTELRKRLREIIPDLRDQYTGVLDETEYARYWEIKMRSHHAFQIDSALHVLETIGGEDLNVVDVGDSSGNHCNYLKALAPPGRIARTVSINLDPVAVEKVREKGGEAVLCRAEEIETQGLTPDLMLLFETLEHFSDPLRFLHTMAANGNIENILLTVPYRADSRFGGALIRQPYSSLPARITPEVLHIMELSPDDWSLLAMLAGYRTSFRRIYLQYPRRSPLRAMRPLWRKFDFEGFLALYLQRDTSLSDRYTGW
ncbi:MAG: methyltransferase domain-containing protein [Pseudomonadota bacterium]|nr:methyltransferase domain-containing protein [Pseudomonadota bacterium]